VSPLDNRKAAAYDQVMKSRLGVALAVFGACLFVPSAGATLPGYNGLIAFSDSVNSVNPTIWTIEPDGSGATNLTPGVDAIEPAWSPDGTKIAYVVETDPGDEIWVMNADGSDPMELTSGSADTNPAWSPDGGEIAFSSTRGGAGVPHIWVMNSNGSNIRQLTTDATTVNAVGDRPDWSPDGTKIAFDDAENIYVMNADGTDPTRLTTDPGEDVDPSFSPNGEKIIYAHSDMSAGAVNIYEMSATGTGQTALTGPDSDYAYPVWSPDGTKIALIQASSLDSLLTIPADGSGFTILVSDSLQRPATPSWQRLATPPVKTLAVSKAGSGQGTVTSSPAGISCGTTCSHEYDQGAAVTLTAAPATGSTFSGWSGACSGTTTCTDTTDSDATVTATFDLIPKTPTTACVVPNVKGKTLAAAKRSIDAHHCSLGRVRNAKSRTIKKGHVISQKPKPGRRLAAGAKVGLVVSKGRAA
jgi:Tol biopolymer transport system component